MYLHVQAPRRSCSSRTRVFGSRCVHTCDFHNGRHVRRRSWTWRRRTNGSSATSGSFQPTLEFHHHVFRDCMARFRAAGFASQQLGPQRRSFFAVVERHFECADSGRRICVLQHDEPSWKGLLQTRTKHFEAWTVVSTHAVFHVDLPFVRRDAFRHLMCTTKPRSCGHDDVERTCVRASAFVVVFDCQRANVHAFVCGSTTTAAWSEGASRGSTEPSRRSTRRRMRTRACVVDRTADGCE